VSLRICVVGATGSTGRRAAQLAAAAGHSVVLAGRDRRRLELLAGEVGAADVRVLDLGATESVQAAIATAQVVVSCVGPFTRFGLPVARAAIATRTPYVDTCGEPQFCNALLREGAGAQSALVTAVGASSLLADLATVIALRTATDPYQVTISYRVAAMRPSRGSVASEAAMVLDGAQVIRDGRLKILPAGGAPVRLPQGRGIRFPVPDVFVISRYCTPNEADAYLVSAFPWVLGAGMRLATIACGFARARSALERVAAVVPSMDDGRPHGRFAVTADLDGRWVTAAASDVYGFTAAAAVHVAEACAKTTATGLRAASQVVDDVESTARHLGVQITTSEQPIPKHQ
jgi:putative NADH-flavin reductase